MHKEIRASSNAFGFTHFDYSLLVVAIVGFFFFHWQQQSCYLPELLIKQWRFFPADIFDASIHFQMFANDIIVVAKGGFIANSCG